MAEAIRDLHSEKERYATEAVAAVFDRMVTLEADLAAMQGAPRACVIGVVRDESGRLLLGRRLKNDSGVGKWVLPGGGIEGRETFAEAVRREVSEECGVLIEVGEIALVFRHLDGPTNNVCVVVRAEARPGSVPRGGDDLGDPAFFSETDLRDVDVTPATREIISAVLVSAVPGAAWLAWAREAVELAGLVEAFVARNREWLSTNPDLARMDSAYRALLARVPEGARG